MQINITPTTVARTSKDAVVVGTLVFATYGLAKFAVETVSVGKEIMHVRKITKKNKKAN